MAKLVTVTMRPDGVALVRLDEAGAKFNTLSIQAVGELDEAFSGLDTSAVRAVVLCGKPGGALGAGANIGELLAATEASLHELIERGHRLLNRIEDFPVPVVAAVGKLALGGIFELALSAHARTIDAGGQVGFPEINLLLFPGLFGGPRAARRAGLERTTGMILDGKPVPASAALETGLVDEIVPAGEDSVEASARLALALAEGSRQTRPALAFTPEQIEAAAAQGRAAVDKATRGRGRPRSGYVFLDSFARALQLPREEAQRAEEEAFFSVTLSPEGRAGMRFFFVNTGAGRPPKALKSAHARPVERIGVAGIDGYMGNAIAWLALANAGTELIGWTAPDAPGLPPAAERLEAARKGLLAKFEPLVHKGRILEQEARAAAGRVHFTTELADLAPCQLVVEAIAELPELKLDFFQQLGAVLSPGTVVASNSSSMGPGFLSEAYIKGGGRAEDVVNLHFFSPAEHPAMALVEVVLGEHTSPDAALTAFQMARSMKKTPVVLKDGSAGFFVNACLAAFMQECERLLEEGTPVDKLDRALVAAGMPQGFATLLDTTGLEPAAGLLRFTGVRSSVIYELVERNRRGKKTGGGFYDYDGVGPKARPVGVWPGLGELLERKGERVASDEEIAERCFRAMYVKARELLEQGIVDSKETADLAMVLGVGFPVYLGGVFFHAEQQGWDRA
jgi:3-hydroxyacyl-CoA dehydrogenase/enoyl-CoA hydratase/carnithine racemase